MRQSRSRPDHCHERNRAVPARGGVSRISSSPVRRHLRGQRNRALPEMECR